MTTRSQELVRLLELARHPEGGFYRELFRSTLQVAPQDGRPLRAAVTGIYYLLAGDQISRWHRIACDEIWHLCEGGPLELLVAPPNLRTVDSRRLDRAAIDAGPVAVVPANWWQAARPIGPYALVGCTVAPGVTSADFQLLRGDAIAFGALPDEYRLLA
jgi:uncharacterized protein